MPPIYIFPTISHFELKLWFSNGGTLWYHQEYIKCLRWLTTLEMYYTKNAAFWSVWILFCAERTTKADLNQEKSSMLFCLISRKHISAITKGKHILILSKSYCCSVCVFLDVTPQGPSTDLQKHAAWLNWTTGILILIIKKYGIMLLTVTWMPWFDQR